MFIQPMLLEKREEPFDDDRYVYEPKIDGHRNIISIENGNVRLFTRHGNDVTAKYPELHSVPIDDASDTVLDGEVACINPATGSIDFEMMQSRSRKRKAATIDQAMIEQPVSFFAFDILRYRGRDLRSLPLKERKAILSQVLGANGHFSRVLSIEGDGTALFEVIQQKKLEGIVAKSQTSRYVGRRSSDWLKVINYQYADVEISGYRKHEFGWILQHQSRPVGILDLYVPLEHKKAFYGVARKLVTGEDRNHVYVRPDIKARVRFRQWYRSGMLRDPEFVGFVV